MTGLLLCGGKSSRMGSDKGLLPALGITWAEAAYNKLASVVSNIAISVNREQLPAYTKHFTKEQLIVDEDVLQVGGPLRGLFSAHIQMPQEDILLFACDLLYMETPVFNTLLLRQKQSRDKEAFVFTQDGEDEPLCGIYTAVGLSRMFKAYQNGQIGKQSMKHVLETLHTERILLPENQKHCFKNINTRQDLSQRSTDQSSFDR